MKPRNTHLEGPLRGFRIAVVDFSREIRSAAWEPGFAEETDALFREKVEPEIERIEQAVRENRSIGELAWRTAHHGVTPATIGAVVGGVTDLTGFAGAALGLGPLAYELCWTAERCLENSRTTNSTSITELEKIWGTLGVEHGQKKAYDTRPSKLQIMQIVS